MGLARSAFYTRPVDRLERNRPVIEALNGLVEEFPRLGYWKYVDLLAARQYPWKPKRIHRVYCAMGLSAASH